MSILRHNERSEAIQPCNTACGWSGLPQSLRSLAMSAVLGIIVFASDAFAAVDCTVIADSANGKILVQHGECDKRYSPASSFKIALALMGYDAGILTDENNPAWPYQEGYTINKDDDKGIITPLLWEKNSVVWYSQKLTTLLGAEKFQYYVNQFDYGNKDVSGDNGQHNGLTNAWLSSSLQITPLEQITFLQKLLNSDLHLSAKAYKMTQSILPVFETANGWKIRGKTGTGKRLDMNGVPNKTIHGWFVGWAQKEGRTVIFAKLIDDAPSEKPAGPKARNEFLAEFPSLMP